MAFNNYHIAGIFIITSLLVSCNDSNYTEEVKKYPEIKVAEKWTLRLPFNLRQKTGLKDNFYQQVFVSPSDSITFKVSTHTATIEDGVKQFNDVVENEKQGKVFGPCMGSSKGYSKDYNFIDLANMLSGVITDYEENGWWEVMFGIFSAKTGDGLSFAFEKVSPKDVELIHEVIRSIRYYK